MGICLPTLARLFGHLPVILGLAAALTAVASAAPEDKSAPSSKTPLTVEQSAGQMPDAYKLNMLIRTTLIALNQANQTGNYSVLRDLGTPQFQAINTDAKLAEIFAALRNRKLDLSPLLFFDPKLIREPAVQSGLLRLTGYIPTDPERILFDMGNEVSIGAKDGSQTYTTPGITSGLSQARQTVGPLEVVTSDQAGHLATDGGLIFDELSKLNGGVAVAMAMTNPDLVGSEVFGLSGNVAYWEQNVALGFSAMGVLGRNMFGQGERLAISGAVGASVEEKSVGRQGSNNSVGGRAGAQITW
jgi:hypothetical protein